MVHLSIIDLVVHLSIIDLVVSHLFVLGAYMGARFNVGWHCQYLRQQFETI